MYKISFSKKNLIAYVICFAAIFILSQAEIFGVKPFAFGCASVLVCLGFNPVAIAAMLLFSTLPSMDVFVTLYTLYGGVILILCGIILNRLGNFKPYFIFIPALVCSAGQISYMITAHFGYYKLFLYLFLLFAFTSVCYCFGLPTLVKKLKFAFVQHEAISGFVFLTMLASGLKHLGFYGFDPLLAAFGLLLPLAFKIFGAKNTLIMSICLGIGSALDGGNIMPIAVFSFTAVMTLIFVSSPKPFMPIVILISYSTFILYFNVEYRDLLFSLAALAVGGVIYMLIPTKAIKKSADFFNNDFSETALRYIVNQSRYETGNSLAALGGILCEMASVMLSKEDNRGPDPKEVSGYIRNQICVDCAKYSDCKRIPAMNGGLAELCAISIENGRAGIGELPTAITQYCCNVAGVIASASEAADKAARYREQLDVENRARDIVAGQLNGLSEILKKMGQNASRAFSYDPTMEKRITEELVYIGAVCSEALVTGIDEPESITLIMLSSAETESKKLEECICGCVGKKFKVVRSEDSILSGYKIVELKRAPIYDALFGFAGRTKEGSEISGDTHSFVKLTHDKFMMALCDGMGSGQKAHEFSETTISLIESFYKAGFDHDLVLENVNKFLSIGNADIFSAVDVCVADLGIGVIDIVKIGSPAGYLKTDDSLIKISGEALPMGMLDEIKPTVRSMTMKAGDIMILMSDGICDSFAEGTLDDFVNNLPQLNPSELCAAIVERAVGLCGGNPKDDMSVAAFKLFYS